MFGKFSLIILMATFSTAAFAVDGVTLINQSTVLAAGGFPYTISQPGSYQLSGNLTAGSTTAIKIAAIDVTLDLNGFTISCTSCSGVPGISSTAGLTSVSNGSISGFSGPAGQMPYGIYFGGSGASADRVKAYSNGWGIYATSSLSVTNSVLSNNRVGVECLGALVIANSQIADNAAVGIFTLFGTVTGNTIDGNGTSTTQTIVSFASGIAATAATIMANSITNNGRPANNGYAIWVNCSPCSVVYGQNSFFGNRSISSGAALSLGTNVCDTGVPPGLC